MASTPLPIIAAAVGVGGSLGAVARAGIAHAVPSTSWPWATFLTNAIGCLLIGILIVALVERHPAPPDWVRPLLVTGVLGGFTTFSTYALETWRVGQTHLARSAAYALGSILVGVLCVHVGRAITRRGLGLPHPPRGADLAAEEEA